MLTNDLSSKELYKDINSLVGSLGFETVEVLLNEQKDSSSLRVVLYRRDREINTDDLEVAYNVIYPRYSVMLGSRDLTLEVTSPGLQRNFKDFVEFSIFTGKDVRLYSISNSCYVIGKISECGKDSISLTDYLIEDKNLSGEKIAIPFSDIAKAKLEYRWEGRNA